MDSGDMRPRELEERVAELERRMELTKEALDVLGQIVKLQGARLENLEDKFESHHHVPVKEFRP